MRRRLHSYHERHQRTMGNATIDGCMPRDPTDTGLGRAAAGDGFLPTRRSGALIAAEVSFWPGEGLAVAPAEALPLSPRVKGFAGGTGMAAAGAGRASVGSGTSSSAGRS